MTSSERNAKQKVEEKASEGRTSPLMGRLSEIPALFGKTLSFIHLSDEADMQLVNKMIRKRVLGLVARWPELTIDTRILAAFATQEAFVQFVHAIDSPCQHTKQLRINEISRLLVRSNPRLHGFMLRLLTSNRPRLTDLTLSFADMATTANVWNDATTRREIRQLVFERVRASKKLTRLTLADSTDQRWSDDFKLSSSTLQHLSCSFWIPCSLTHMVAPALVSLRLHVMVPETKDMVWQAVTGVARGCPLLEHLQWKWTRPFGQAVVDDIDTLACVSLLTKTFAQQLRVFWWLEMEPIENKVDASALLACFDDCTMLTRLNLMVCVQWPADMQVQATRFAQRHGSRLDELCFWRISDAPPADVLADPWLRAMAEHAPAIRVMFTPHRIMLSDKTDHKAAVALIARMPKLGYLGGLNLSRNYPAETLAILMPPSLETLWLLEEPDMMMHSLDTLGASLRSMNNLQVINCHCKESLRLDDALLRCFLLGKLHLRHVKLFVRANSVVTDVTFRAAATQCANLVSLQIAWTLEDTIDVKTPAQQEADKNGKLDISVATIDLFFKLPMFRGLQLMGPADTTITGINSSVLERWRQDPKRGIYLLDTNILSEPADRNTLVQIPADLHSLKESHIFSYHRRHWDSDGVGP
jgi:hypothetical protein